MDTKTDKAEVEKQDGQITSHTPAEVTAPIIVSLGKKPRKTIKRLKRGKGRAMDEVMDVIDQVQTSLAAQAEGKILVPVVIIYRQKQRRLRGWL
jgi:signal recognition particle GTPase